MKVIGDREIEQFYQILELPLNASQAEVKSAFRMLARKYHPDRFSGDAATVKAAEDHFKTINTAYEFLKTYEAPRSSTPETSTPYKVEFQVARSCVERTPVAFVQEARRWQGLGNLQEAMMALDTAIALQDDYYPAYELRSELRLMLGNVYGSKVDLRRAKHFRWVYKSEGRSIETTTNPKAASEKSSKPSSESSVEASFAKRKEFFAKAHAESQATAKKSAKPRSPNPSTVHPSNPPQSKKTTKSSYSQPEKPVEKPVIPQPKLLQSFQGHLDIIRQVLFVNQSLISASNDGSVRIFCVKTGELQGTLMVGAGIIAIAASPTSNLFITGDRNGKIKMWNLADRKLLRSLPLHTGSITAIHFSPNGKAFATTGEDGILKIFQLQPASLRHSLQVSMTPIFSSGLLGGRFFTASADSKLRGIDSGKIIQESDLSSPLCKAMAINVQKRWVVIGDDRASVHCFSANGDLIKSFSAIPEGKIRSLVFVAGGDRLLVAGASPLIKIWDVETWDVVMEWEIDTGHGTAIAASGKMVAIATDHKLQLWQLP